MGDGDAIRRWGRGYAIGTTNYKHIRNRFLIFTHCKISVITLAGA